MSFELESAETMKTEVERILKRDNKFGSLHRIETTEEDQLILTWDDPVLRPRSKSNPSLYMAFMEEIADCLSEFGYCLEADEGANEKERNNYLLIVPEDESDFDD